VDGVERAKRAGHGRRKASKNLPITLPCLPQFKKPDKVIGFLNLGTSIPESVKAGRREGGRGWGW